MINLAELQKRKIEDKEYLVYCCKDKDEVDKTELEMLRQNQIPGVCAFSEQKIEDSTCYCYDVTGMSSYKKYVESGTDEKDLKGLYNSVKDVLAEADEYMLYAKHYVGMDSAVMVDEAKPMFVVLPLSNYDEEQVTQEEFLKPLQEKIGEFPSDIILLQNSSGTHVHITKPVFKLGRDGHQVDYMIKNPVVGRLHATLYIEDGALYIVDEESKNGTYIDEQRLESGEKTELKKGDVFRLGTEEFTYA